MDGYWRVVRLQTESKVSIQFLSRQSIPFNRNPTTQTPTLESQHTFIPSRHHVDRKLYSPIDQLRRSCFQRCIGVAFVTSRSVPDQGARDYISML